MRPDNGLDQAEGLRRLLVRARHGEAEPSGAGVAASHLLPQSAGRDPHPNPLPEGEGTIALSPSGGKLDRGLAITSDLASVFGSPSRMASSFTSNVSEVRNQMRVVTVAAGKAGVGRTSVTVNLAAALARSGKDVLVLDENPPPNNLPERLRLPARFDLLDVIQARCSLDDVILRGKGCSVLPAPRAMRALQKLENVERRRLEEALAELDTVDVMLVDAAAPSARGVISSGLTTGASLLVVTDATASGITASYALIKRMALENACLRFGIIVNKAGGEQEAKTVFGNMAKVARRNLAARLDYLGHIPSDNKLVRATQLGRPVVEAFPTAASAKSYLELAQSLLRLPTRQDEPAVGIPGMMQSFIKHITRQPSGEMPLVVN